MKVKSDKQIIICGHGSCTPSTKNLYEYSEARYLKNREVVCVRRFKPLGKSLSKRLAFKKKVNTIIDRNIYDQDLREYVYTPYKDGKYYSDCSSSYIKTLEQLGYKFPWTFNTAAIMTSDLFEDVPVIIKKGHIMNPEILKYGDGIMFKGSDPSRPKGVGHIEYVYGKVK